MPLVSDLLSRAVETMAVAFDYYDIEKCWVAHPRWLQAGHAFFWRWGERFGWCNVSVSTIYAPHKTGPYTVAVLGALTFSMPGNYAPRTVKRYAPGALEACSTIPPPVRPLPRFQLRAVLVTEDIDQGAWWLVTRIAERLGVASAQPPVEIPAVLQRKGHGKTARFATVFNRWIVPLDRGRLGETATTITEVDDDGWQFPLHD